MYEADNGIFQEATGKMKTLGDTEVKVLPFTTTQNFWQFSNRIFMRKFIFFMLTLGYVRFIKG